MSILEDLLAEARQHIASDESWATDNGHPLEGVARFLSNGEALVRSRINDKAVALEVLSELIDRWPTPRDESDWIEAHHYFVDDWVGFIAAQAHEVIGEALDHESHARSDSTSRLRRERCAYCEESRATFGRVFSDPR